MENIDFEKWKFKDVYRHWRYTPDREFLAQKVYPWFKDVAIFPDQLVVKEDGKRKLPISSSPEIYNNPRAVWFAETTNFDLALQEKESADAIRIAWSVND